jgi:hypothetical protein
MPSCEEMGTFVQAYFVNELPPDVRKKFEVHLLRCKDCKHFVDSYRKTMEFDKYLVPPPLDPEFNGMIMDYLMRKRV